MTDTVDPAPRRRWLVRTLEGGVSATLVALLYPVVRFLRPRAATESGAMEMVAPYRMDKLNPDAEGHAPGPFDFGGRPCLLVKTGENTVKAFNALCTHTDCTVEYRPGKGDIFSRATTAFTTWTGRMSPALHRDPWKSTRWRSAAR